MNICLLCTPHEKVGGAISVKEKISELKSHYTIAIYVPIMIFVIYVLSNIFEKFHFVTCKLAMVLRMHLFLYEICNWVEISIDVF